MQYSGVNGLYEAIGKSRHVLGSLDLLAEIDLLSSFFTRIAVGGDVAFGTKAVSSAIVGNAVETLIVTETASDLVLLTFSDGSVAICKPGDDRVLRAETSVPLLDLRKSMDVRVVSSCSKEGAQFEGFQIAAMLRYKMIDMDDQEEEDDAKESDEEFA